MGSKCRNGVYANCLSPTQQPCKLLPCYAFSRWQSLSPSAEPQTVGDQPLPRADLLFPKELRALLQPSQGIIRGNLSPSPELSTLAQCSGLFPLQHGLWELSKHCCSVRPRPQDPCDTLWDSGGWREPSPTTAGCASSWWELFPEDGCHEDGAKPSITPSTNWLPCFGGQGISELQRLMSLLCNRKNSPGQG